MYTVYWYKFPGVYGRAGGLTRAQAMKVMRERARDGYQCTLHRNRP